ncbi:hypothetical protein [Burkholderia cenocepacia]|uniref:hypothetical protein n=1 Tax=Burkholderia cenocepacia TaxID=95486 RepID=UPI0007616474|nr:hypothetical protein [Burkholderia cenocepacia]KWU26414.1 hypothetical protein AS149_25845 [Burkholderia cenocepacia]
MHRTIQTALRALSVAAVLTVSLSACAPQEKTGTPGATVGVASRDDITTLARKELPRAATALKLERTPEGRQSCVFAFDDKATSKATFSRGKEKTTYDMTVHWDRGYSQWKVDAETKVMSLEDLRSVIKKCITDGVVTDRYHSQRFEHDD